MAFLSWKDFQKFQNWFRQTCGISDKTKATGKVASLHRFWVSFPITRTTVILAVKTQKPNTNG
jgi:hypothetical protein